MKKILLIVMLLAVSCTAQAEGFADYTGGKFVGSDPWEGELTVTIESIDDNRMDWTLTEAVEDVTLCLSINDTELTDGVGDFHIMGISQDNESIAYDYTGTVALSEGAVIITFTDGQTTQLNANGGSGFHMVGALEEDQRAVPLARVQD